MMRASPKIVAWALAASTAVAVPLIASWEGLRTDPYDDLAGIPTVCYGETRAEMRSYSPAECEAMLRRAVEGFTREVLACTPGLAERPYQLAAAVSLAYNIGATNYCGSTAARRFNAGDIRGGCEAFAMWRLVKGKVSQGLVNRRAAEMELCLVGVSHAAA